MFKSSGFLEILNFHPWICDKDSKLAKILHAHLRTRFMVHWISTNISYFSCEIRPIIMNTVSQW